MNKTIDHLTIEEVSAAAKGTQPVIQPKSGPIREPIFNSVTAVQEIPDELLAGELRRRGWDVKATRTTIEEL